MWTQRLEFAEAKKIRIFRADSEEKGTIQKESSGNLQGLGGSPQVFCLVTPMFKRSPDARERNTKMHRRSNSESLHEVNTVHALVIRMKILVRHGVLGRLFRRASP